MSDRSVKPARKAAEQSVSVHQARLVIIVAAVLGLLIGISVSIIDYVELRSELFESTEKAAQAFERTATLAVTSHDARLAAQVADGLFHFDTLVSVEITDDTGTVLVSKQRSIPKSESTWFTYLFPPVGHSLALELMNPDDRGAVRGVLRVAASSWRMSEEWSNRLGMVLVSVLAGIVTLAAILIYISQRYVTRPLLELAAAYRRLNADDPSQSPIPDPDDFEFAEYREIAANGARLMLDIARNSEVRDLTANELFRSQKRFQDFAEISSDWFWETDRNGGISYISSSFTKTLNKRSGEIYGRTLAETTSEDTRSPKWQGLNEIISQRRQFRDFRYDIDADPGARKTVRINGRPFYDEAGTFIGYRGIGADVTNERLIAEARNEALQRAEHANRAKSEFLATMSHEFRTPLNAIIGFSTLLKMPKTRTMAVERLTDYSGAIQESGQHMLELVNDILDISAIEAGKRTLLLEEISIASVFTHCLSQVDGRASEKAISLETTIDMASDKMLTDERSIRQILLNLLTNAVKFTPSGGSIRCVAAEQGSDIVFRVEDTGIGISKDRLPTIAEPFSNSSIHPHVAKEGTGLGLSIVRSLAHFLDGSFAIESELCMGTCVTVILPRIGQDKSPADEKESPSG